MKTSRGFQELAANLKSFLAKFCFFSQRLPGIQSMLIITRAETKVLHIGF